VKTTASSRGAALSPGARPDANRSGDIYGGPSNVAAEHLEAKHLAVLNQACFVKRRKLGVYARYSVSDPSTFDILALMQASLAGEMALARRALEGSSGPLAEGGG
jgi:hypothetical protein